MSGTSREPTQESLLRHKLRRPKQGPAPGFCCSLLCPPSPTPSWPPKEPWMNPPASTSPKTPDLLPWPRCLFPHTLQAALSARPCGPARPCSTDAADRVCPRSCPCSPQLPALGSGILLRWRGSRLPALLLTLALLTSSPRPWPLSEHFTLLRSPCPNFRTPSERGAVQPFCRERGRSPFGGSAGWNPDPAIAAPRPLAVCAGRFAQPGPGARRCQTLNEQPARSIVAP